MFPTFLFKLVARVVLFSYCMQLIAPAYAGLIDDPHESPKFLLAVKARVRAVDPFQRLPCQKRFPTLSLRMTHKSGKGEFCLAVDESHLEYNTVDKIPIRKTNFLWKMEGTLGEKSPSQPLDHPWKQYLKLQLSETGALRAEAILQPNDTYQSYNYIFHSTRDVILNHLLTEGFIDVRRAKVLSFKQAYGQSGVRLMGREILSSHGDHLASKGQIFLQGKHLRATHSLIEGQSITACLGKKGQQDASADLTGSLFKATDNLDFYSATEVFLQNTVLDGGKGPVQVKSEETILATKSKILGQSVDVMADRLHNNHSIIGGTEETNIKINKLNYQQGSQVVGSQIQISGDRLSFAEDSLLKGGQKMALSGKHVHLNGAIAGTHLSVQGNMVDMSQGRWMKDLSVAASHSLHMDWAKFPVEGAFSLQLPQNQEVLDKPINIPGKLILSRSGDSLAPFKILADVLTKSGLTIHMPTAELSFGAEASTQPMVKIQAREGAVKTNSRSLDIIKAQLYSKTGMDFEVKEKQIHIGRGIESKMREGIILAVLNKSPLFDASNMKDRKIKEDNFITGIDISSFYPYEDVSYFQSLGPTVREKMLTLHPFKSTNGTVVYSDGPFRIKSPQGVLIESAELYARNTAPFSIFTNEAVISKGGKINIQGDFNIRRDPLQKSIESSNTKGPIFQNIMEIKARDLDDDGVVIRYTFPYTVRTELTVGGNFIADRLENHGSFVHIGGSYSCPLDKKDVQVGWEIISSNSYFLHGNPTVIYPGDLSAKSVEIANAKDLLLEGMLQSPLIAISFENKATIGRLANYRRPPTIPFQQMKNFIDVLRPTALFHPVMDSPKPWINQPTVPLSWKVTLPPAVGIGPKGLYLLGTEDKFLLHPLQEIDALPGVFGEQLRRGYLDASHPNTRETYIRGRFQAYELYQKFFAPKALEDIPSSALPIAQPQLEDSPERALSTLTNTLAKGMTEEELKKIKFMMLYYPVSYEDKTVHLPASWVSKQYDNPKIRNPDGGVFGEEVYFLGLSDTDILHNLATIHGENDLTLDVNRIIDERQSYRWIEYRTNTSYKKGNGWFSSDKYSSETVAIPCSAAQHTTGVLSTGPKGKIGIKAKVLNVENGAEILSGDGGTKLLLGEARSTPALDTYVVRSEGQTKGAHVVQHGTGAAMHPALIGSTGGIEGTIGLLHLTGTQVLEKEKDINFKMQRGHLGAGVTDVFKGITVEGGRKTVTITRHDSQIACPSALIALKGDVNLTIEEELTGDAPTLYGKNILLDGKTDFKSLLLRGKIQQTSETKTTFSSSMTRVSQEIPIPVQTYIEGRESITFKKEANLTGAHLKAPLIVDETKGMRMGPTIGTFHHYQETTYKSPLAHGSAGTEGWAQHMIAPKIEANYLIHKGPEEQILLADNTRRSVKFSPGDDNACAFVSIMGHLPGFNPRKAREEGVKLLLQGLKDPELQPKVCALMAPEIVDALKVSSDKFCKHPAVQPISDRAIVAQNWVDHWARVFIAEVGESKTKGLEPKEYLLLEGASLETKNELRNALEALAELNSQNLAWAQTPEVASLYTKMVIAQPGLPLNYSSEHEASTSTMDALAMLSGANLKIYRDTSKVKGVPEVKPVHHHITNPEAQTVELIHQPFLSHTNVINHFDRLMPFEDEPLKMNFTNVEMNKSRTQVMGEYEENFYQLLKWQRSWTEHHQVIPQEAVVVIALAVSAATSNPGLLLGENLFGVGTLGSVMFQAGFTTLSSAAVSSLAQTGDPFQTLEDMVSKKNLVNVAINVFSAGILHKLAPTLKVNMSPGQASFTANLKKFGLINGVNTGLKVALGQEEFKKSVVSSLAQTVIQATASTGARLIGGAVKDPVLHKVSHGVLAASLAKITGEDPTSAAAAAVAAELLAEEFCNKKTIDQEIEEEKHPKENYEKVFAKKRQARLDWVRLSAVSLITALGGDPTIANVAADNALSNNFAATHRLPRTIDEEEADLDPTRKKTLEEDVFQQILEAVQEEEKERKKSPQASKPKGQVMFWDMYVRDWKEGLKHYGKLDYLNILSYAPVPFVGSSAALACEGREIYKGTQTFGGAIFDMGVGIVVGKTVIWAGQKIALGAKYIWQKGKAFVMSPSKSLPPKNINWFLLEDDLGSNVGGVRYFCADTTMKNKDVVNIFVQGIEGKGVKLRNVMEQLIKIGKERGGKTLEIEAMITNTKLKNLLIKRFHLTPGSINWDKIHSDDFWRINDADVKNWDKITIPLTAQKRFDWSKYIEKINQKVVAGAKSVYKTGREIALAGPVKAFQNYKNYGVILPKRFGAAREVSDPPALNLLTRDEVLSGKHRELIYVITEHGELKISNRTVEPYKITYHLPEEGRVITSTSTTVNHALLGQSKPTFGAGELKVVIMENGERHLKITTKSGCYAPQSESLPTVLKTFFERNGYKIHSIDLHEESLVLPRILPDQISWNVGLVPLLSTPLFLMGDESIAKPIITNIRLNSKGYLVADYKESEIAKEPEAHKPPSYGQPNPTKSAATNADASSTTTLEERRAEAFIESYIADIERRHKGREGRGANNH